MAASSNIQQPVATFVFVDLEATGLNGIGEKPRITELSLVATHRASLLEKSCKNTPRVLNKLTLCLDPCKAIGYEASVLTGLYNDALSLQCPFSEGVVDLCTLFFEQLPPPICLLAHNGYKYDFPLLTAELFRLGRHFPADILCVDTLDGFRDVLSMEMVQADICAVAKPMCEFSSPTEVNGVTLQDHLARPHRPVVRRLVMSDTDRAPLSNTTPEMQVVKANDKITNAPMKKPVSKESPNAVRVSSAKRKLEFGGPPTSETVKNAVDDVDREDVMDDIHGFRLVPSGAQLEKCGDTMVSGGLDELVLEEIPPSLWEDDLPDDVLAEAMDEFEQNLQTVKSFETGVLTSTKVTSRTTSAGVVPPVKSWASIVQGTDAKSESKLKENTFSPKSSCSKDADMQPVITSIGSPVTSNKPVSVTKQRTPPNTIEVPLVSYPTPPPSEHKNSSVLSSNLSPLATPFIPQHLRLTNQLAYSPSSPASNALGISMALSSLHKRLLGYEPLDLHRAEDDCMALLRLCNRLSPWFCEWVDKHATLFNATTPMYKARKRPKKP